MICEGQIIMLYTLNLYCAICQLYLSKTGGEKKEFMFKINMVILFQGYNKVHKMTLFIKGEYTTELSNMVLSVHLILNFTNSYSGGMPHIQISKIWSCVTVK